VGVADSFGLIVVNGHLVAILKRSASPAVDAALLRSLLCGTLLTGGLPLNLTAGDSASNPCDQTPIVGGQVHISGHRG
jgi:hypothetical protein